jgi:hypothetical protein
MLSIQRPEYRQMQLEINEMSIIQEHNGQREMLRQNSARFVLQLIEEKKLFVFGNDFADYQKTKSAVRSFTSHGETKNNFIFIDAARKIKAPYVCKTEIQKEDFRAKLDDDIAKKYNTAVFTTHELFKDQERSKPVLASLKGSADYGYNAKFVIMIYPQNQEQYEKGENQTLLFYVAKNKLSKGRGKFAYKPIPASAFIGEMENV